MVNNDMWQKTNESLTKKFQFDDFDQAADFVNKIFAIARKLDHHPKLTNEYSSVEVSLSTHSAGNKVTEKDEDFAEEIDNLFSKKDGFSAKPDTVRLFTDGGSRGNPGPSAIGYVICNSDETVVKKFCKYIGESTNNKAEYQALLAGLQDCLSTGAKSVQVFMDSELIVNQMTGKYKVKNQDLKPLFESAKQFKNKFDEIIYTHIPREQNGIADGLVNEALDETV
jgi:ribonuclease HI/pterin-4a-carbinolamine dehydratase